MYFVVYFSEENTYDVRNESQIIYEGGTPCVGQHVEAAYKCKGGRSNLYEAEIVLISGKLYSFQHS